MRILYAGEHEDRKLALSVEELVSHIKADIRSEGVRKYMGRILQTGMEKTKERLGPPREIRVPPSRTASAP